MKAQHGDVEADDQIIKIKATIDFWKIVLDDFNFKDSGCQKNMH